MGQELWQRIAADAGHTLGEQQLARLGQYLDLLIAWNERINLTRIVNRADAEVRHVADALTLLRFLPANVRSLVDVGTGGGVPGVPLAIARPDVQVTLIDSTRKKLDAIAAMVAEIGLSNVTTLHSRIEAVERKFDVITARAVADIDTLLDWCERLMHPRSVLLAPKGPKASEEIAAIDPKRGKRFNIDVHAVDAPELPGHVIVAVSPRTK